MAYLSDLKYDVKSDFKINTIKPKSDDNAYENVVNKIFTIIKPKSDDNAYEYIVNETFNAILKDDTQNKITNTKHDIDFSQYVGCSPIVMANIDKLYDDVDVKYASELAFLNIKFKDIMTKRIEYITMLLDKKDTNDSLKKNLEEKLDNIKKITFNSMPIVNNLLEQLIKEIEENIKKVIIDIEDIKRLIKLWYKDPLITSEIKINTKATTQLPEVLKSRIENVLLGLKPLSLIMPTCYLSNSSDSIKLENAMDCAFKKTLEPSDLLPGNTKKESFSNISGIDSSLIFANSSTI